MREGAVTRERILAEALTVFSRQGFEGARMEKIATGVGINKASLYFHFKSKEEIFRELFRGITERYRAFTRKIIADSAHLPTSDRLAAIHRAYLEDSWDNAELSFWNRVFYFPPEALAREILQRTMEVEKEFQRGLLSVFEEGLRRGEIKPLEPARMAKTFYYLLAGISMSVDLLSKAQGLEDMEGCFALFWAGIKP